MSAAERPVVGGRYELAELLGRGGMAEVRKGTDTRLGRTVAVKRLRTDLAGDDTFQARFRREAQSSASLNHPAIVAVYDTGEEPAEDGSGVAQPYIVMEHVAGRTLRDILREGRKILPERALEITSGVLAALDYSHRAGIIHRDIKPGNVMLTPAGDVKVMDFGIARAMSDAQSTMTQTAAVVGTAQYLSPEQARGEAVDSRSDVYSAGCLLYELLTSRPPFVGDSPVAVAYQHVREQPRPPSDHDTDLPPEVDAIVLASLAKRVEDRYQSAAEMRADIERYLAGEPVRAALGPAAAGAAAAGAAGALAAAGPARGADAAGPPTASTGAVPPAPEDPDDEPAPRRGLLLILVLLALLLIGGTAWLLPRLFESEPDTVPVPEVVGVTETRARAELGDAGLVVGSVDPQPDDRVAAGRIVSQDPGPTEFVAPGSTVDLVVSSGPEPVTVPSVVGQRRGAAADLLRQNGLRVTADAVQSDEPAGEVVATDPAAGQSVPAGSRVTLSYSRGPEEVPDVRGLSRSAAESRLREAGFSPQVRVQPDTTEPRGTVVDQLPAPGETARQGSDVAIFVSQFRPEPSPSPTPSPSEEPSPSPSRTPSPTPTPTPSPSETPSPTPTPSPSATPSEDPSPSETPGDAGAPIPEPTVPPDAEDTPAARPEVPVQPSGSA